jgi:hypothetical protein
MHVYEVYQLVESKRRVDKLGTMAPLEQVGVELNLVHTDTGSSKNSDIINVNEPAMLRKWLHDTTQAFGDLS